MLADAVYWLVHNDYTGRARTSDSVASLMVAAGVLGELIEAGLVETRAKGLFLTHKRVDLPSDEVGRYVYGVIVGERQAYPITDWLDYLAVDVRSRVGARMAGRGTARAERAGIWRRRRTVYLAENMMDAGWVYDGIANAIRLGEAFSGPEQLFVLRLASSSSSLWADLCVHASPAQVERAVGQLTVAFYGDLLGSRNPIRVWSAPAAYALALLAGLAWGGWLRARRPDVYAAIGTGLSATAPVAEGTADAADTQVIDQPAAVTDAATEVLEQPQQRRTPRVRPGAPT